jgi:hypothetical protein
VQLRRDEVDPFKGPVSLDGPGGGQEGRAGGAVGEILQDHRVLGQDPAVVEGERGHLALRVDREVVATIFGSLGGEVDLDDLVREPGLGKYDVRRQGAGARLQV